MTDEILYEQRPKLPVWGVAQATYLYLGKHARLLALPTVLFLTADFLTNILALNVSPHWSSLWRLVSTLVGTSLTVGVHRTILARETREGPAFFRWDTYLWSYIKLMMLVGFVGLILILAGFWFGLGLFTAWLATPWKLLLVLLPCFALFLWVMTRISLAFPLAALGEEDVLVRSWRATRGNVGRLIVAGFLTLLPIALISISLLFLPSKLDTAEIVSTDTKAGMLVAAMLLLFSTLKAISTLIVATEISLTYQMLHPPLATTEEVESD